MGQVQADAHGRPHRPHRLPRRAVQPEDADHGKIEAVQHGRAGGKVVEALGQDKVAGVEERAEDPRRHADGAEANVPRPQRVCRGHMKAQAAQAGHVRPQVAEREDDRGRLLNAEQPEEGPFPVELDNVNASSKAVAGDNALAGLIALAGTVP